MAATYVHSNTVHALEAAGRDFPDWPLFLTGHSMGGAPANICNFLKPVRTILNAQISISRC